MTRFIWCPTCQHATEHDYLGKKRFSEGLQARYRCKRCEFRRTVYPSEGSAPYATGEMDRYRKRKRA